MSWMKWYLISMCFDFSWNTRFFKSLAQLWLSQYIKVGSKSISNNPASSFWSHTASHLETLVSIHYAYVVLSATNIWSNIQMCFFVPLHSLPSQSLYNPEVSHLHPRNISIHIKLYHVGTSTHVFSQPSEHVLAQPYTDSMCSPQNIYLVSCSSSTSTNQPTFYTWWHPLSIKPGTWSLIFKNEFCCFSSESPSLKMTSILSNLSPVLRQNAFLT